MNRRDFVIIVCFTCIALIIWIVADILYTPPTTQIDPKLEKMLEPVNPVFNPKTVSEIQNRSNPTPLVLETPTTSESASNR